MFKFITKSFEKKKKSPIIILLIIFSSFLIVFPAGSFNSTSMIEQTSEYLADVAKNHTTNGNYAALMVEPNDYTTKKVLDPYSEFIDLYGIFREGLATYIGAANSDKKHNINIEGFSNIHNFSFLGADRGFGITELKDRDGNIVKDEDGNIIYRHGYYPLDFMFYNNHPYIEGQFSFLSISQSCANELLDSYHLEHTRQNYQSLLNTLVKINVDGDIYLFAIDNIYFEHNPYYDGHNYFYEAINEIMGEFFFGGARYPTNVKRQAVFFLRQFPYQNKYYIEHATSLYSRNDYVFKILEHNFLDNFILDLNKIIFEPSTSLNALSYLLFCLSGLGLTLCIILLSLNCFDFHKKHYFLLMFFSILPYLLFWFLYLINKNVLFFSNLSTNVTIILLILFTLSCFFVFLKKRTKLK